MVHIDEPLSVNTEKLSLTLSLGAQNVVLDSYQWSFKGYCFGGRK